MWSAYAAATRKRLRDVRAVSIFSIRQAGPDDIPLVTDSFWRDYKTSPYTTGTSGPQLTEMLCRLISSPGWHLVVAYVDPVVDEICGWLLYRSSTEVGWIHVKAPYRRRGCARTLLEHAGVRPPATLACAFSDPIVAQKIAAPRGLTLRFRPYMVADGT